MKKTLLITAALTAITGAAQAQDLAATFGFTDMGANWNAGTNVLLVSADENNTISTSGDLTNYLGESFPTTALFNSGFADGSTSADSEFEMTLSNITATSADATGSFTVTDINGDTLSGSYIGTWTNQFGFGFFDAEITIANYSDGTEAGNEVFEGNAGQTFVIPSEPMNGGLSMLLQMPEWFDSQNGNFNARTTQLDGILVNVPTPGSLALLGMGGALVSRRRR
ncbi:MAG: PEP-CTERM sorting domain-containing protein [Phycisphaerales bacterium]